MAEHVIKLPDVGEGVAEAELVEWHVKVGDPVREDTIFAAVMTDKATVEIPSPVEGIVAWIGGEIGETIAVGSPIVRIDMGGETKSDPQASDDSDRSDAKRTAAPPPSLKRERDSPALATPSASRGAPGGEGRSAWISPLSRSTAAPRAEGERPLASPAVRLRAREAGVDLRQVAGSGPAGRIGHEDLDAFIARGPQGANASALQRRDGVEEVKIVGLRRRIAEKMALAKSRIPHITYVEEVDVSELEDLRAKLNAATNAAGGADRPKLTILPFLMLAMAKALEEQPALNATFDDDLGVVSRHRAIHIGIAAQTTGGLMVPVARHVEARDLWHCASEAARLAEAARSGTAVREELTGSTITITSLGAMGGVATTPVINHPEVAIVGVNKIMMRPVWDGTQFVPRKMMNLSSSFDHRVIDGWDAAVFVQRLKALMETPAMLFVE